MQPHPSAPQPMQRARSELGFTLIELLVGLLVMAILAGMSWRGIDGMARAQAISRVRADQVSTLATALAQWQTDLDHITELPGHAALDFDGRVLRMTRSYDNAQLRVVGWSKRNIDGQLRWLRWQSDPLTSQAQLQAAWLQILQWAQNPGDAERQKETVIANIDDWQIFYYRNGTASNPLSSSGQTSTVPGPTATAIISAPGGAPTSLPDGVRLILTLSPGQPVSGVLTREWVRVNF